VDNAAAHRASSRPQPVRRRAGGGGAGQPVVLADEEWTAFVPFAARWPYEVHLYP